MRRSNENQGTPTRGQCARAFAKVCTVAAILVGTPFATPMCQAASARGFVPKLAHVAVPTPPDRWEKQRWIEKTVRFVRPLKPLGPSDDLNRWLGMSQNDIVDELLSQSSFGEMVLDFNLYFLGFRPPSLMTDSGTYTQRVYYNPSAITSALETVGNGDYLSLLRERHPVYLAPLGVPQRTRPEHSSMTDAEVREDHFSRIVPGFTAMVSALENPDPAQSKQQLCGLFAHSENHFHWNLYWAGVPLPTADSILYQPGIGETAQACYDLSNEPFPARALQAHRDLLPKFGGIIDELRQNVSPQYRPTSLGQIRKLDPSISTFGIDGHLMGPRLYWWTLRNSSTNFNRKRASYFLKRFFCDDLTPVPVPPGSTGPGSDPSRPHGSDPACLACHHRLDPMAGFFRSIGGYGQPYDQYSSLVFDDGVKVDRATYDANWAAPAGSGRTWEVGYVRSTQFPSNNTYGDTFSDLFSIIQTAPEVKECIVRRLNQYLVGEEQNFDNGYVKDLAQKFTQEAGVNSAVAFKNAVKRIVLSQAFSAPQRDPAECYDFVPGTPMGNRPPCRIASVLTRNCTQCHGDRGTAGGLNLNQWTAMPDGTMNFIHTDYATGDRFPRQTTLRAIIDRLTELDPARRMPLRRYIDTKDREEIFLWATQEVNALNTSIALEPPPHSTPRSEPGLIAATSGARTTKDFFTSSARKGGTQPLWQPTSVEDPFGQRCTR